MSIIERRRVLTIGLFCAATIITLSAGMQPAAAQARVGNPAPAFSLTDSKGRAVSLAEYKGKTVVLEWTNHQCPYVGKHYRGNNMQALQKKWTGQGVVWLSMISSAPGLEGHVSPQQANQLTADRGAAPTAVLFDPTGKVGHAYGARATPHMYVINGEGVLVYIGGIDDQPTARLEDLKSARNFVDEALSEISQGNRCPPPVRAPMVVRSNMRRETTRARLRGGLSPQRWHPEISGRDSASAKPLEGRMLRIRRARGAVARARCASAGQGRFLGPGFIDDQPNADVGALRNVRYRGGKADVPRTSRNVRFLTHLRHPSPYTSSRISRPEDHQRQPCYCTSAPPHRGTARSCCV